MKQTYDPSSCTLILFSLLLMFNFISVNDNIHCSTSEHEETNSEIATFCITISPQHQKVTRTGNTQILSEGKAETFDQIHNTNHCCVGY